MGVRIGCANCHNHPLDRWTQDDYHGLAAVFARIDRGRDRPRAAPAARSRIRAPESRPSPASQAGRPSTRTTTPGRALADWLTDDENPYFARAVVNWLWASMFGRGLVEPVDDLRATNPATHPELLDPLAADFVAHGYDFRHTLRLIATSGDLCPRRPDPREPTSTTDSMRTPRSDRWPRRCSPMRWPT